MDLHGSSADLEPDVDAGAQSLRVHALKLAASRVGRDTLLVVDLTDVSKPYARHLQYLASVRNSSREELRDGYWLLPGGGVVRRSA